MAFGPLRVTFDDRVLRPRAWTVAQAEWAAEVSARVPAGPILELCSGAGHIGLAAAVLSGRALVQVDIDPHACALAGANARVNAHSLDVDVRCGDLGAVIGPDERYPIVLADPPYLPSANVASWPSDPRLAIDGGADGLDLPRRCVAVAGAHLVAGGVALLQLWGVAQLDALGEDLAGAGLAVVDTRSEDDERAVALLESRR